MDSSSRAMTNRSLRTIRTELEFLLDSSVLDQTTYDHILSQLPTSAPSNRTSTPSNPTPVSTLPTASLKLNEKASYSPAPTPVPSGPPPPAYGAVAGPPPLAMVKALYDFKSVEAGDLGFVDGDLVAVTEYTNTEWWKGRNERTGAEGIFPRSYVQIEEEKQKDTGYGNMPIEVSEGGGRQNGVGGLSGQQGEKVNAQGKKFGKKLGNAAIFGAGATIGGRIVNGIF
ncbi:MAG: hypothetical protein M1814_001186 [Vezdaea aestivalis]|nr:MAG: hypothetical protein M1814_001186 [Vezdaea aestivalis]